MERSIHGKGSSTGYTRLREEVADALERLSRMLISHANRSAAGNVTPALGDSQITRAQQTVRFLGQVAAGWAYVPREALPTEGAGFGSTVFVEDVEHGALEKFTLMTSPLLDLEAGHVSLASPIGQALLRARAGDIVVVDTPQRRRTLRVLKIRTLQERLREEVLDPRS